MIFSTTVLSLDSKTVNELIGMILEKTASSIDDGKLSGQIIPQKEKIVKCRVKNFRDTNNAVQTDGATGNDETRNNWSRYIQQFYDYVTSIDIYQTLNSKLTSEYPENTTRTFNQFLRDFIRLYLDEKISKDEIQSMQKSIVASMDSKPFECGARIEMTGIVVLN